MLSKDSHSASASPSFKVSLPFTCPRAGGYHDLPQWMSWLLLLDDAYTDFVLLDVLVSLGARLNTVKERRYWTVNAG
jgi:hypothetical protein